MSQYQRRPSNNPRRPAPARHSPAPRRSAPPRRPQKPSLSQLLGNPLVAIALVALAVLVFVLVRRGGVPGSNYYCEGIYINNQNMSAYTRSEGEKALNDWASSLLEKRYTLDYEGTTWSFTPKEVGARINTGEILGKAWNLGHTGSSADRNNTMMSLRYSPQYFETELTFDEEALDAYIQRIADSLYIEPVDADIVLTATRPMVIAESHNGRALNTAALREELISRMQKGGDTLIELDVRTVHPSVSSSDAEHGLELIVEYSTDLSTSSSSRCSNVSLALSNFNGFAVRPGEVVSFNEIVGERTVLRGYNEAPVYYGTSVTRGVGGGVCQASSTLYPALLRADMTIVERHNHSMVVAYCEASTDAAVSEDASQDFVFANNTESTIYIYVNVNREKATVMIYGRRPDYRIELQPTILQTNIKNTAIATVKDESGNYAYYTDEYKLKSVGKLGRRSMLERVYYDWDTGEEVKRETVSEDFYQGERDTYWVGVHPVKK